MDKRFSHQQLLEAGALSDKDLEFLSGFRGSSNRLGAAYQLIHIRLLNTVPRQTPFEPVDEILTYTAVQMSLDRKSIGGYGENRKKVRDHRDEILAYAGLRVFSNQIRSDLERHMFGQAQQYEQFSLLMIKADRFLRSIGCLLPPLKTLTGIVVTQRKLARRSMFDLVVSKLSAEMIRNLDGLLKPDPAYSTLEKLKRIPKNPSSDSVHSLIRNLMTIENTGVLSIDIGEVHNNYQRALAGEVKRCSAARLRKIESGYRYASMVSFLLHCYSETVDHLIETFIRLLNSACIRSDNRITQKLRENKENIRTTLEIIQQIREIVSDHGICGETLRKKIISTLGGMEEETTEMTQLRSGPYSNVFILLAEKYGYFRKFMPAIIASTEFTPESRKSEKLLTAVELLKKLDSGKQRRLPGNAPLSFLSKKQMDTVIAADGKIDRKIWECGLYCRLRDELKNGNINVTHSKRYRSLSSFSRDDGQWRNMKDAFFLRSGMPQNPDDARNYLKNRLNNAYDRFLGSLKENDFARIVDGRWALSGETSTLLSTGEEENLNAFSEWIEKRMRMIKLPDLLLEVNNDLNFSDAFLFPDGKTGMHEDDVCGIIATIMAHGCNIGMFTMSRLVQNISYSRIRSITDWQLTEDALRTALSWVVNAISKLEISRNWGSGETSSSDTHLKFFKEKVISRHYSPRLGDFALEFLTFIADNFAPFHSRAIECTEGEAPYCLDGFLYNESNLILNEHFTDTRAAATIIFSAFVWFGRLYNPRIRGIHRHNIFRIDRNYDYGALEPLLDFQGSYINLDIVAEFWERMAQYYFAVEQGHVTASVALRRLLSRDESNDFYKANLHLGRIFKTEHILQHMSDPQARQRKRRGLLKGEQMHQLARDVNYGNRGKITARDDRTQNLVCSCLTLIMACIVYWQAKELMRVIAEHDPEKEGFSLKLLGHISPIGWGNIIVYGEYFINRDLVKKA
jgi:TnpA family transposase